MDLKFLHFTQPSWTWNSYISHSPHGPEISVFPHPSWTWNFCISPSSHGLEIPTFPTVFIDLKFLYFPQPSRTWWLRTKHSLFGHGAWQPQALSQDKTQRDPCSLPYPRAFLLVRDPFFSPPPWCCFGEFTGFTLKVPESSICPGCGRHQSDAQTLRSLEKRPQEGRNWSLNALVFPWKDTK